MARDPGPQYRSGCPASISLEVLGDRWSLLIVRDLMVRGYKTFREFKDSGEGIATNILSDRLRKLKASRIIDSTADPDDGRIITYRLTDKGIDLAPVLLELLIWGARHENTSMPDQFLTTVTRDREGFLAEVRRRWRERDPTPLIPKFGADSETKTKVRKKRRNE